MIENALIFIKFLLFKITNFHIYVYTLATLGNFVIFI